MLAILPESWLISWISDTFAGSRYENGQVEEQATYRNGRRDGTVLEFYPDGRKRYEATFSGGKLEAPELRHGEEALKHPHSLSRTEPAHFVVEFQTSAGDFSVSVDRALAPLGADRFYSLVSAGFYDQCRFFRGIPDFMAQFGYHGDPAVTAAWLEATIDAIGHYFDLFGCNAARGKLCAYILADRDHRIHATIDPPVQPRNEPSVGKVYVATANAQDQRAAPQAGRQIGHSPGYGPMTMHPPRAPHLAQRAPTKAC